MMKKLFPHILFALSTTLVNTQNLPEVFSAIPIVIKENHSGPEFANDIRAFDQGLSEFGKGIGAWISYGDRGERKNKMAYGFTFDLKETRDYYFPSADAEEDGSYPKFGALMQS